ncbi:MAG: ferrochelatase [Sodalis sp. Ffu]|nr:MAG: ferrochelatase [Sodalis sp. Ffu]
MIDAPRWFWLPLLYGIILPLRSPQVAKLYQSIWMEEGSPLLVYSRLQQQALASCLTGVVVELAMSYGEPMLHDAIKRLIVQDITKLVILPLYPQYSCATSAAIWDAVARILTCYRRLPSITFIRDYAQHPIYIMALKASIERSFAQNGKPDRLIISFHGIPQRYVHEGDDYPRRCEATSCALVSALDYPAKQVMVTFQSRFGRDPWLLPATDETMKMLPSQGVRYVQLICPGFSSDCLETLEEIQVESCRIFKQAGGERFYYIPALNDDAVHIDLLRQLIIAELK